MIPVLSNSSIKGFIVGEQFYWVISRSMDMVIGTEYYSKRGWAPNGDFRYKGPGLDLLVVRCNALLDRGVEQPGGTTTPDRLYAPPAAHSSAPADAPPGTAARAIRAAWSVVALGRKDLSSDTRVAGNVANSSPKLCLPACVQRQLLAGHQFRSIQQQPFTNPPATTGSSPRVSLDRFQTFASSTNGDEARIIHMPNLRYDVLDRPLSASPFYWSLGTSLDYLSRSEPLFHARNVGRIDFYPHLSLPISAGGWSVVPEVALRDTFYTGGQNPDLTDAMGGTPSITHSALNRTDVEARVDIRPPALERDFALSGWNRELRHVIEPELTYSYVGGIGAKARNVLLVDTTDIATNTNEVGLSLTQRFFVRPTSPSTGQQPCAAPEEPREPAARSTDSTSRTPPACPAKPRECRQGQLAGCGKVLLRPQLRRCAHSQSPQCLHFHARSILTGVALPHRPAQLCATLISRLQH